MTGCSPSRPRPRAPRRVALALLALALPALAAAAPEPRHDLILVDAPGSALRDLAAAGYDLVGGKPGVAAEIVATAEEQVRLRAAGYAFVVKQADLETFYAGRDGKGVGFGAFHTYSETNDRLDELHALYPAITTAKWSIGTTAEGRAIWALKVSDNPDLEENEPEVLFDALHHAREPMSTETCLLLIEYLGAHYDTDPYVRWLVDEREIFFVPVVNPDGYVYNELTNQSGGGMWRKNRRVNGDGSYGVDINRNYPYQWVGPGSSDIPSDITYRGPYAGSEPETQALMNFSLAHQFQVNQSFHTYSDFTLFPWGYTTGHTPDDALFREVARAMTAENGYTYGQPPEILYEVNGGAIDWQYGEQSTKGKTIAFSNEIGGSSDGFWPLDSRIPALFADNLGAALHLIEVAGPSMIVKNVGVAGGDGNGRLDAGETAAVTFDVQNGAVMLPATNISVTVSSDDAYLRLLEAERTLGSLAARATWSGAASPIPVAVDASCPTGHVIPVTLHFAWDGGERDVAVGLPVGAPTVLFNDTMETGAIGWNRTSPWAVTTTTYHSATRSLTDSPGGNYANNANVSATIRSAFNFTLFRSPVLRFWHRYAFEANYDYGYVEVSLDGGTNWQTIRSYTGTQTTWQEVVVSLAEFEGQASVRLRFRLYSDTNTVADGWYVDDVSVSGYGGSTNAAPTAPVAVSPVGGELVNPAVLTVQNATDADGPQALTYGFRLYLDPLFTQASEEEVGVVEGAGGQTSWSVPFTGLPNAADKSPTTYYWRAWADDGAVRGPMCAAGAFAYDPYSGVPGATGAAFLSCRPDGAGLAFSFALAGPGRATLAVYNLRGERVATLFSGEAAAATGAAWDQRDARGRRVASGLYVARLEGPATSLAVKVVVVR